MNNSIRLDELVRLWAEERGVEARRICFDLADLLEQRGALPEGIAWVADSLGRRVAGVEVTHEDLAGYFNSGGRGKYLQLPGAATWYDVDQGKQITESPVVVRRRINAQQPCTVDAVEPSVAAELEELRLRNDVAREAWGYGTYEEWRANEVWLSIARLVKALTNARVPVPQCLQGELDHFDAAQGAAFLKRQGEFAKRSGQARKDASAIAWNPVIAEAEKIRKDVGPSISWSKLADLVIAKLPNYERQHQSIRKLLPKHFGTKPTKRR